MESFYDKIPKGWKLRKVSRIFNEIGSGTTPNTSRIEYFQDGEVNWVVTGDLNDKKLTQTSHKITTLALKDYSTLRLYDEGALCIAMYGATIGKTALLGIEATVNQACCILDKGDNVNNELIQQWFIVMRPNIVALASGGGQPNISQNTIRELKIALPSKSIQDCLVNELKKELLKIDTLISQKEQLISILTEKRQALITQAVTKGLDPKVKLVDSGIDWLGKVPEEWALRKMSRIFSQISSGTTPKSSDRRYYDNGKINWVLTGDLNDDVLFSTKSKVTEKALQDYTTLKVYPKGSLCIAMYGATIGKTAILKIEACTNQACCILFNSPMANSKFVQYWFMSHRENIVNLANGGGQPNISQNIIRDLRMAIPSIDEQNKIVNFIEKNEKSVGDLLIKIRKSIILLKERRTALISAAVTGQLKIPEK